MDFERTPEHGFEPEAVTPVPEAVSEATHATVRTRNEAKRQDRTDPCGRADATVPSGHLSRTPPSS